MAGTTKICTIDEVCARVGTRPRRRTVVMCHGVFDLVHPGHIRHLLYAKSKADILVASITADVHVTKALFRPFVPQELRALNLAALEAVDYVIIDEEATPLANLARIQPDFFAKGYEYINGGSKTQEEVDVIESYGGEVLFTPGDIVFSSSAIIESKPPDITIDKLHALMQAENITFNRLRSALEFRNISIHVVGDTIVDSLTHTTMIGGMTKTPTPSVRFGGRQDFIGGAGIVAAHLNAAGAKVTLTTVLGDDPMADFVINSLAGIEFNAIIDRTRPTTQKNVFICEDYRLLKVDTLDNRSISDDIAEEIAGYLDDSPDPTMGVVFSDFRHGIFNRRTIPRLIAAIPPQILRVADSQVASRWGNILDFTGFDLITPNEREARFALADQDTGIRPLAAQLYKQAECGMLILKLGNRGVLTCRRQDKGVRSFFVVDSFADRVIDAVGAGDALLAYATLALINDGCEVVATILGSVAAALECEVEGNIPISRLDVLKRLDLLEKHMNYRQ